MKDSKTHFEVVLGKYINDISDLINESSGIEKIRDLENLIGKKLPEDFVELYSNCDGENGNVYGLFAGFKFMDIDSIVNDYKGLLDSAYKISSDKSDVIKEGRYRKGWLPFASYEGSYLVLDLDPDKAGNYGQMITLDEESDISHVIANSLKEFINFIGKSFQNSKLIVTEDKDVKVVAWKSGYLFDDMINLKNTVVKKSETFELDEFWQDYFKRELTGEWWKKYLKTDLEDGKISSDALAQIGRIAISGVNDDAMDELSLEILEHMPGLKELCIYSDKIKDFSALRKLESLKELTIGSKAFKETDFEYLRELDLLKELSLHSMSLNNLGSLNNLKSLRELTLSNMSLDLGSLNDLKSLRELTLSNMSLDDLGSLNNLTSLKSLELIEIKDFNGKGLSALKNLTELYLEKLYDIKLSEISELKK